jgi:capsule polysaccharide export protein KpsE/RkpR
MSDHYKIEFLDYLVLIVKWKKTLLTVFFSSLLVSYGLIFLFVPKQYESTATILPSTEDNYMSGLYSMMKNFSSVMPGSLGNIKKESEMDLYKTIIYSRASIENLIDKFNLQKLYKIKKRVEAIEIIGKMIKTKITLEDAFTISMRASSPQLASDLTNYLVKYLNDKIVDLNVTKSKENRFFLEQRYNEIKLDLRNSEDSLKAYQEKSGVMEAEKQTQASVETYGKLESELSIKQVEYEVLQKIYGQNSPIVANGKISLDEFKKKYEQIKAGKDSGTVLIGLNSIPKKGLAYARYYRNVKICGQLLEFIMPLFEQAKFEEEKMVPILQVLDHAIPMEKRVAPQRIKMAGLITCSVMFIFIFYLILKEMLSASQNPKIRFIKNELFHFKKH